MKRSLLPSGTRDPRPKLWDPDYRNAGGAQKFRDVSHSPLRVRHALQDLPEAEPHRSRPLRRLTNASVSNSGSGSKPLISRKDRPRSRRRLDRRYAEAGLDGSSGVLTSAGSDIEAAVPQA